MKIDLAEIIIFMLNLSCYKENNDLKFKIIITKYIKSFNIFCNNTELFSNKQNLIKYNESISEFLITFE